MKRSSLRGNKNGAAVAPGPAQEAAELPAQPSAPVGPLNPPDARQPRAGAAPVELDIRPTVELERRRAELPGDYVAGWNDCRAAAKEAVKRRLTSALREANRRVDSGPACERGINAAARDTITLIADAVQAALDGVKP